MKDDAPRRHPFRTRSRTGLTKNSCLSFFFARESFCDFKKGRTKDGRKGFKSSISLFLSLYLRRRFCQFSDLSLDLRFTGWPSEIAPVIKRANQTSEWAIPSRMRACPRSPACTHPSCSTWRPLCTFGPFPESGPFVTQNQT